MAFAPVAPLVGAQSPRVGNWPAASSSALDDVLAVYGLCGPPLDEWQELVLGASLGELENGTWAAQSVGVCVPRQNGKDGLLEARELGGIFVLEERLIVHTAHLFATSMEHFRRVEELLRNSDELSREVKRQIRSHGEEGFEFRNGARLRFLTRTKGGGRGWSGDCTILNEAMEIQDSSLNALMPALSARPNPQLWYTGSAVDRGTHDNGVVFARIRERGLAGDDASLAYFEWGLDFDTPDDVPEPVLDDPEAWADVNPAFGVRISRRFVEEERKSLSSRGFAVERLGVGDWPDTSGVERVIPAETWDALADPASQVRGKVCFAFAVSKDRSYATIGAAGRTSEGRVHVEVVDRRRGTGWVAERCKELKAKHHPFAFVYDSNGPAASLEMDFKAQKVKIEPVSTPELSKAFGMFVDQATSDNLRHLGTPDLAVALAGAVRRPLGDGNWAWGRKNSATDISPLEVCTLADWGLHEFKRAGALVDLNAALREAEEG